MRFTQEEFDIMVEQVVGGERACYDMLCTIADKVLRPSVISWCRKDETLKGRGLEEDVMQDIHRKLLMNIVTGFLKHKDLKGEINRDPHGFQAWLFEVARNVKRDMSNKRRSLDMKTTELDGTETEALSTEDPETEEARVERLRQAFDVVLSADLGVHKVLTWLAQSLYVLELDITRIRSTDMVLEEFSRKTLGQMFRSVQAAASRIPWIYISPHQYSRICAVLDSPYDDRITWGQVTYESLFMLHNGKPSGKKSVSDWVNRVNSHIKRRLGNERSEFADGNCNGNKGGRG